MIRHICLRLASRFLLPAVILFQLPRPEIAQGVTLTAVTRTLAEWLDRLAAEFDRNGINLFMPGAVLVIVRGEEVIFAGGFHPPRVEIGVELARDTFTLPPSNNLERRK